MAQPHRLGVLFVAMIACAGDQSQPVVDQASPSCGADRVLSGAGVGDFKVGQTVEQVRATCEVLKDTTLPFGTEGQPERRLSVRLDGDTVQATIQDGRVWRIEIRSPRFRTNDSVGVGSSLSDLRKQPVDYYGYGEGGPFVGLPRHCGLSLELNGVPNVARTIEQVPPDATVARILVLGCERPSTKTPADSQ